MIKWLGLTIWAMYCLFACQSAQAAPYTWPQWVTAAPYTSKQVPPNALIARGTGTTDYYVLEANPATGGLLVEATFNAASVTINGTAYADSARNVYSSTNVTTGAWVQVIASTAAVINWLTIFDSCGQTLELGIGALASETRTLIIPPGGITNVPLRIAAGTRVSLRAISATCSVGEFDLTALQ